MTYQQSRFLNLMEGYGQSVNLYKKSLDSAGTAQEKFNLYQQGTEAQLNKLKATWEGVWMSAFKSNDIQALVGGLNGLAGSLKFVVDNVGLLPTALGIAGMAFMAFNSNIRQTIMLNGTLAGKSLMGLITGFKTLDAAFAASTLKTRLWTGAMNIAQFSLNGLKVAAISSLTFLAGAALPIAAFMALSFAISKVTEKISAYNEEQKKIQQETEKLASSYSKNEDKIKSLTTEYENLNNARQNGKLDTTQEERYQKVQNDLNKLLPSLTQKVDSNGNAHLKSAEAIKKEITYLDKLSNLNSKKFIENFSSDVVDKASKDIKKISDEMYTLQHGMTNHDSLFGFNTVKDNSAQNEIAKLVKQKELKATTDELINSYKQLGNEYANTLGYSKSLTSEDQKYIATIINKNKSILGTQDGYNKVSEKIKAYIVQAGEARNATGNMFSSNEIDGFSTRQLDVLGKISTAIKEGDVNWSAWTVVLKSAGFTQQEISNIINNSTDSLKNNTAEVKSNADIMSELESAYKSTADAVSPLNGLLETLAEGKKISAAEAMDLISKEQGLADAISIESGQVKINKDAVLKLRDTKIASYSDMQKSIIAEAQNTSNATISKLGNYKLEIKAIQSLAEAKSSLAELNNLAALTSGMGTKNDAAIDIENARKSVQGVVDAYDAIDKMTKLASQGLKEVGTSQEKASKSADKNAKSTKKAASETNKAAKEYEQFTYVTDEFNKSLEESNKLLDRNANTLARYDDSSANYRKTLEEEIKLLEEKNKKINAGIKSIDKQISTGKYITPGVVNKDDAVKDTFYVDPSNKSSSSAKVASSSKVTAQSSVSASDLNKYLKGELKGLGATFVAEAKKAGIDPAFLASIAMHESGNGTSNAVKTKNNAFGIMGSNGLRSFKSVEESVKYTADMLKRLYTSKGKDTVAEIQKSYAPDNAKNDPNGLNSNWQKGVTKFWNQFTGTITTTAKKAAIAVSNDVSQSVVDYYAGFKTTTKFGEKDSLHKDGHDGIDLANGKAGDPVKALKGGKVITATYSKSAGNWVVIKQDDGTVAKYMHMQNDSLKVKAGQTVKAGTTLGNIGSTGRSTGNHLHLQVDKNGVPIDPVAYYGLKNDAYTTTSSKSDNSNPVLKMGSKDSASVKELQKALGEVATGIFDKATLNAVKKFQKQHGLKQDGVVGNATWGAINTTTKVASEKSKKAAENQQNKTDAQKEKTDLQNQIAQNNQEIQKAFVDISNSWVSLFDQDSNAIQRQIDDRKTLADQRDPTSKKYRGYLGQEVDKTKKLEDKQKADLKAYQSWYEKHKADMNPATRKDANNKINGMKDAIKGTHSSISDIAKQIQQSILDETINNVAKSSVKSDKALQKIENQLHMTDGSNHEKINKLNDDKLNQLKVQKKEALDNIAKFKALTTTLKGNAEALKQNADEIQKWQDTSTSLDLSIYDQQQEIRSQVASSLDKQKEAHLDKLKKKYDEINASLEKLLNHDEKFNTSQFTDSFNEIINELDRIDEKFKSNALFNTSTSSTRTDLSDLKDNIKQVSSEIERMIETTSTSDTRLESLIKKESAYANDLHDQISELDNQIRDTQLLNKQTEDSLQNQINLKKQQIDQLDQEYAKEDRLKQLKDLEVEMNKVRNDKRFSYIDSAGNETLTFDKGKMSELEQQRNDMVQQFQRDDLKQAMNDEVTQLEQKLAKTQEINAAEVSALQLQKDTLSSLYDQLVANISTKMTELQTIQETNITNTETNWNGIIEAVQTGQIGFDELMTNWYGKTIEDITTFNANLASQISNLKNSLSSLGSVNVPSGGSSGSSGGGSNSSRGADKKEYQSNVAERKYSDSGSSYTDYDKKGNVIGGGLKGTEKYHDGGIVGKTPATNSKLTELANKLFNVKPGEQIIKSLVGELQIPPKNIPNLFTNINNLVGSIIPKTGAQPTINEKHYHFKDITIKTNNPNDFIRQMEFLISSE